jgi:hypothetical protein
MESDWIKTIAVIATVVLSAISLHIGVWRKFFRIGEWKGKVDADRSAFKEFMKEVKDDIREINKNILRIFSQTSSGFIYGASPLRLTEQGQEVAKKLNATDWAEKTAEILKNEVADKEAYNIQEFCFVYASRDENYANNELKSILEYAYSNGVPKENVQSVFGIELRDKLLKMKGLEAP